MRHPQYITTARLSCFTTWTINGRRSESEGSEELHSTPFQLVTPTASSADAAGRGSPSGSALWPRNWKILLLNYFGSFFHFCAALRWQLDLLLNRQSSFLGSLVQKQMVDPALLQGLECFHSKPGIINVENWVLIISASACAESLAGVAAMTTPLITFAACFGLLFILFGFN